MMLDLCRVEDGPVWIKVIAVEAVSSTAKMYLHESSQKWIYRFPKLNWDRIYHKKIMMMPPTL